MPIPTWLRTPPENRSKVERKYTLALSPESSELTKVVVTPRRGRPDHRRRLGEFLLPFFSPPSLPEKNGVFLVLGCRQGRLV